MKTLFQLTLLVMILVVATEAQAGRRALRVDQGAWNVPQPISLGGGTGACPEAGFDIDVPVFNPGPSIGYGWVDWMGFRFMTSGFDGLDTFYCQTSKQWTQGADPGEYLNEEIFPEDEADLAYAIGPNTDNAVTAVRYSFVDDYPQVTYGRQWTFYFFANGTTIVALHGVQDNQSTYEYIYDYDELAYVFRAETDYWDGGYFCFQGKWYYGDCVAPVPPPPEEYLIDGFE